MPIKDYNTDPDLNTTISGINIAEGCAPSGINNAIRQLMADVKAEKEERDTAQAAKDAEQDEAISSKVSTVNGLTPDSNGNVDVGGMPLGSVFPYTGKDVPAGTLRADGTTYTNMQASFPEFYDWVVESGFTVPLADYTLVEGSCGYYGLDTSTGTVRMPALAAGVFGTTAAWQYGQAVQAGLPNITGTHCSGWAADRGRTGAYSGSWLTAEQSGNGGDLPQPGNDSGWQVKFDASLSNPIYGRSDTVTPPHVKYPWVIVVYNAAVPPSVAQAGEFVELLDGKADKTQIITPKAYITETWGSGYNWYRKWSDGWIEQGGRIIGSNTTGHQTFHTAFSSDVYTLLGSGWRGDTSQTPHFTFSGRSSTSFSWGSSEYTAGISWYACGY